MKVNKFNFIYIIFWMFNLQFHSFEKSYVIIKTLTMLDIFFQVLITNGRAVAYLEGIKRAETVHFSKNLYTFYSFKKLI